MDAKDSDRLIADLEKLCQNRVAAETKTRDAANKNLESLAHLKQKLIVLKRMRASGEFSPDQAEREVSRLVKLHLPK